MSRRFGNFDFLKAREGRCEYQLNFRLSRIAPNFTPVFRNGLFDCATHDVERPIADYVFLTPPAHF